MRGWMRQREKRKQSIGFIWSIAGVIKWVNNVYGKSRKFKIITPKLKRVVTEVLNEKHWPETGAEDNDYALCCDLTCKMYRKQHKRIKGCAAKMIFRMSDLRMEDLIHECVHAIDFVIKGMKKQKIHLTHAALVELRANGVTFLVADMLDLFKEHGVKVRGIGSRGKS